MHGFVWSLDFGIWDLAAEIATHLSGARSDTPFSITKERIPSRLDLSLRGARFLAYARNRLRNLVVGLGIATLAGWFILGAEASSADVDFLLAPFYHNRSSVNIR